MSNWEEVVGHSERAGPQGEAMYWRGEGGPFSASLCSYAEREQLCCGQGMGGGGGGM